MSDAQKNRQRLDQAGEQLYAALNILHEPELKKEDIYRAIRFVQGATAILMQIDLYLSGVTEPKIGE